ncbi:hypothetical protein B7463_g11199, partial [Scytalidium lignicola]
MPLRSFPPVRACLFDMDGLLLDTEDKYTLCTNAILAKYNRPLLPWSIKAKLQGRPAVTASEIFHNFAQLPISRQEYAQELIEMQKQLFPTSQPLNGVEKLLDDLDSARTKGAPGEGRKVHIALATSSHEETFKLKTGHLEELFSVFPKHRRVLGDDVRIKPGRGKPFPDIYLLALDLINSSLEEGEPKVKPEECLVFEDSVPGVESGRRAGMRVVWVPHPELFVEYQDREPEVLAGLTGEGGDVDLHQVGKIGDEWAVRLETLEAFPYEEYGIVVKS